MTHTVEVEKWPEKDFLTLGLKKKNTGQKYLYFSMSHGPDGRRALGGGEIHALLPSSAFKWAPTNGRSWPAEVTRQRLLQWK